MTAIVTVYAVFADAAEAEQIGRSMVERRLAACVNILGPCHSIYRWQGAIEEADEIPALFKTSAELAPALVEAIRGLHGYDIPAVAVWPIESALPAYAEWVAAETRPS